MNGNARKLLDDLPYFQDVSPGVLDGIPNEAAQVIFCRDGDTIFAEGSVAGHVYFLVCDEVEIHRDGQTIRIAGAPAILGEQACLQRDVRSATLVARRSPKLVKMSCSALETLMDDAKFARQMICVLSDKLRESTFDRGRRYAQEDMLFGEFRAHVSPDVLNELLASGTESYGQPRVLEDAVVLFADVRNFTSLSSGITPLGIAREVGEYLNAVVSVIHRHGGYVDKFIGDAVMAFWGIQGSDDANAGKALRCAQEMLRSAADCSFAGQSVNIGVGIESGSVFCGNVGSEDKRQFTVLGPAVNAASRYEALTKELSARIVVGNGAYRLLPVTAAQNLHARQVNVKGMGEVEVYVMEMNDSQEGDNHGMDERE